MLKKDPLQLSLDIQKVVYNDCKLSEKKLYKVPIRLKSEELFKHMLEIAAKYDVITLGQRFECDTKIQQIQQKLNNEGNSVA